MDIKGLQRYIRKVRRHAGSTVQYFRLAFEGNEIERLCDFKSLKRPVLLLQGYGGTRRVFQVLEQRLRRDAKGADINTWFPSLKRTPDTIFQRQRDDVQGSWEVMWDLSRWTVARRIHSTRQLQERMFDFCSNLLHVQLGHDSAAFHRVSYDVFWLAMLSLAE